MARSSLQTFTEYTTPGWKAARIHRLICDQFDRVERGEIDRLMLLCPPQHGKSQIASRRYPAFALGRNPQHDVISASAVGSLAADFGRSVRDLIAGPEYQRLFPGTSLSEDSQAKGQWNTNEGGSYYAVGVGGAVMGRGATRFLIDDPFASMLDAKSETTRNAVWEWYQGTVYNRVRPGGAIILIQHRMHEDDLAGRLIEKQQHGGDRWEIVELPAEGAECLWPERYGPEALARIKSNMTLLDWSALYNQEPRPQTGTFFQRSWFKRYATLPAGASLFFTSDFAVTDEGDGADPDSTALGIHGVTDAGEIFLAVDYWCGRTTSDVWVEKICDMLLAHACEAAFGEAGPIRRSVEPFLVKRMKERNAAVRWEWLPSIRDKVSRALALQARASMGQVYVPYGPVGDAIIEQLVSFPLGKHDDDVDMCGMMARVLHEAHVAVQHRVPERFPSDFDSADSMGLPLIQQGALFLPGSGEFCG
jgi:predicted phage terminase large subunit-like protein